MPSLDTLTPQQLDASLADASKDVNPADVKPATLLEQLSRHRRVLLKYRTKGYSADQLVTFLRQPSIGITVSASLIRKVLRAPTAEPKARRGASSAAPVIYREVLPVPMPTAPAGGTKRVVK